MEFDSHFNFTDGPNDTIDSGCNFPKKRLRGVVNRNGVGCGGTLTIKCVWNFPKKRMMLGVANRNVGGCGALSKRKVTGSDCLQGPVRTEALETLAQNWSGLE